MGLQLILCVESEKSAGTDNIYIKETINRFYEYGNEYRFSFINMNGKSNYNSRKVKSAIKQFKTDYKIGETVVIYCIDIDRVEVNPDHVRENKEIKQFILDNNYELIWFYHDVEEVYLGKTVEKSNKKKSAIEFKTKKGIDSLDSARLRASNYANGVSNILIVLDEYLQLKGKR